jgi:pantoate--beta-alanine ligase
MQEARKLWSGKSCGFVPTMGALHAGHAELLKRARAENDFVVLSIFVNPTQFNNPQDLASYPKTWEADLKWASECGVDFVFSPLAEEMYADQYNYMVHEKEFSKELCGSDREGHFDGVLSVVLKLFHLVAPQKSYFGEKDFQQLSLISGMAKAFFLPLEVVGVPTVREADGLAMSSRNLRLTPAERMIAPSLYKTLTKTQSLKDARAQLTDLGFQVVYLEEINGRRFVAAHLGSVRLIDNVPWVAGGPL